MEKLMEIRDMVIKNGRAYIKAHTPEMLEDYDADIKNEEVKLVKKFEDYIDYMLKLFVTIPFEGNIFDNADDYRELLNYTKVKRRIDYLNKVKPSEELNLKIEKLYSWYLTVGVDLWK